MDERLKGGDAGRRVQVSVSLPADLRDLLAARARAEHRTASAQAGLYIEQGLAKHHLERNFQ